MMLRKEVFGLNRRILSLSFMYYILMLLSLTVVNDSDLHITFVATLPLLIYSIMFFMFHLAGVLSSTLVWIIPLLISGLFYILLVAYPLFPFIISTLTIVNIILCYVLNLLLIYIYKTGHIIDPEKEKYISLFKYYHHLSEHRFTQIHHLREELKKHIVEKNSLKKAEVTKNISSLEDKCKAINAVIGRVYSNTKGGSKQIREILKIDRELYNRFSELKGKNQDLKIIISKILHKLTLFELAEYRALNTAIHACTRSETIINILARLDKDPIEDYYKEAKDISIAVSDHYGDE